MNAVKFNKVSILQSRKKSAKVLEMEEFEKEEKKTVGKKDSAKKAKTVPQNVTIVQTGGSPGPVSPPPIPVLKIKDIPTVPKIEPVSPTTLQTSPQKSPALASSKSPDSKGSVIKLLLSSPTQNANPAVATTSMAQVQVAVDSRVSQSGKKSKVKGKSPVGQKSPDQKTSKIRQALQSPPVGTIQIQPGLVQAKTENVEVSSQSDIEIKEEPAEVEIPMETVKETKPKKGSKKSLAVVKDEFLSPPVPSPSVIHVGPMNIGLEVKQESEQSVGKKSKKSKMKVSGRIVMEEEMMDEDFGLDMPEIELGDTGEDSYMEMDDEDSLMMPEEEVETEKPKGKSGKKKSSKGKGKGQSADMNGKK